MAKKEVKIEKNPNLAEGTVVLDMEIGRITNSRRLPKHTDAIETDADRKMLRVSADLYDSKELKAVNRFLHFTSKWVKGKSSPSFFRGGMFLVKHEVVEEIHDYLLQREQELEPLVEVFATVADERKEEARKRLGRAFDGSKYPTPEQIRAQLRIEWRWLTLETPDSLKQVSESIWKSEKEKAQDQLESAVQGIEAMLAQEAKGLADHMIERLTPGEDGKQKVFRNSMVTNLTEFLDNFSFRAIGTSQELSAEVERMRKLLEGVDPKALRENATLRDDVAEKFVEVSKKLDTMVTAKPKRFIDLGEVKG